MKARKRYKKRKAGRKATKARDGEHGHTTTDRQHTKSGHHERSRG